MQYFNFLSDDSKLDADTTSAHSKRLVLFLKDKNVFTLSLSTIWENTDGCAEQYRCASELYLMSVNNRCYSIIIYQGISATRHGKEVVYGLNDVDKRCIYQLMSTVQLPGSNKFDSQMQMHTSKKK